MADKVLESPLKVTASVQNLDLPENLYDELRTLISGAIIRQTDPEFTQRTTLFNGNVKTVSKAVVLPVNSQDLSSLVKFCVKHNLSPSVKAGGYGTGGWAIAGDIMIDLSKFGDISVEEPRPDGSFIHMRDMAPVVENVDKKQVPESAETSEKKMDEDNDKGKGKEVLVANTSSSVEVGAKRERSPDEELELLLRVAPSGSRLVANFLSRGNVGSEPSIDLPSPSIRRRVDEVDGSGHKDDHNNASSPFSIYDSVVSSLDNTEHLGRSISAISTDPAPRSSMPVQEAFPRSTSLISNDPFGYLSESKPQLSYTLSSYQQPQIRVPPQPASTVAGPSSGSSRIIFNSPPMSSFSPPSKFFSFAVKPKNLFAYVTFGAGKKMRDIDSFTADTSLSATDINGNPCSVAYHVPMAAHPVGSSVMLLGGFGFLSRLHGLSIDNLVEAEVVLADGSIVIANKEENEELFWALRGAGPAFGIVTRYKAKMYPVPIVFAGNLIYKFNASTAPSLVKHFRDCIKAAPRELYANVLFTAGPVGKDAVVVIQICYIGPREKGQEYLDAISSWDGERCLLNEVNEKSFLHQQDSVAQILRGKAGRQWYLRSALITTLPDEVIHKTVILFADAPTGCTWLFELAGGAVADFDDTCIPMKNREASFTIAALHQWDIGVDDPRCVAVAEDWIDRTLRPVSAGGPYPCFLGRNEDPTRPIASFGENWERLCALKRRYDPDGLFKNTFWPVDIYGQPVAARTHEPPSP